MASLKGTTGGGLSGVVTITPLPPLPSEANHAYHVQLHAGPEVLVDQVYALWQYSRRLRLGHHWMLYIARILQSAPQLPTEELTLSGRSGMTAPLGLAGSIDWLRVALIRDRRDPELAIVTLDCERESVGTDPTTARPAYVSLALRCRAGDVVRFGRDLEAEYEVARRKREALGLMAWDELESEPEPAGPEGS
jgi:hypothetical protein